MDMPITDLLERNSKLYLIVLHILTVTALAVAREILNRGERLFAGDLFYIVSDAVLIEIGLLLEGAVLSLEP